MAQPIDSEIVIATRNPGKIREIQSMLSGLHLRLRSLDDFSEIVQVEEVGQTYEENATLKAIGYARQTGLCALADDSGLEVEALGGGPGVFSARFGGESLSDQDRTEKLLAALSTIDDSKRAARFVCVMAFAGWQPEESRASGPRLLNLTEGICDGSVAIQARGSHGFGFDPIFMPLGYRTTFAELPAEVKSRISHRARALGRMRVFLDAWSRPA